VKDLESEKENLMQRSRDLQAMAAGKQQQLLASRLVALSEDNRVSKLSNLQYRRQIQTLRQEKKHLQKLLSNIENDVVVLEEDKVLAETKNMLHDIQDSTHATTTTKNFAVAGSGAAAADNMKNFLSSNNDVGVGKELFSLNLNDENATGSNASRGFLIFFLIKLSTKGRIYNINKIK
jgi:hypothetical protein